MDAHPRILTTTFEPSEYKVQGGAETESGSSTFQHYPGKFLG